MADKKPTVELERTYNVPLRRVFGKTPKYKRTNRAVSALREFMVRHMKSEDVKIGRELNKLVWENGIRNPPHHVKVLATKDSEGVVRVELFGHKFNEPTREEMEKGKETSKKEVKEKVKKDAELADEDQESLKEGEEMEEMSEDLEKEELDSHGRVEEEADIKEEIEEIKKPAKKSPVKPKSDAKPAAKKPAKAKD
jgi:large subunit ribosomal protein L31e